MRPATTLTGAVSLLSGSWIILAQPAHLATNGVPTSTDRARRTSGGLCGPRAGRMAGSEAAAIAGPRQGTARRPEAGSVDGAPRRL
jgi:hypothetical protein